MRHFVFSALFALSLSKAHPHEACVSITNKRDCTDVADCRWKKSTKECYSTKIVEVVPVPPPPTNDTDAPPPSPNDKPSSNPEAPEDPEDAPVPSVSIEEKEIDTSNGGAEKDVPSVATDPQEPDEPVVTGNLSMPHDVVDEGDSTAETVTAAVCPKVRRLRNTITDASRHAEDGEAAGSHLRRTLTSGGRRRLQSKAPKGTKSPKCPKVVSER